MKYGLWFIHVYPCMGMQGAERFYHQMAAHGWILDKCSYLADHYTKSESKNIYYHLVPKEYVELENKTDGDENWIYLGENRSFAVYYAVNTRPPYKMFTVNDINYHGVMMQLAGLAAYPICFYYLGDSCIHSFKNAFLCAAVGVYFGFFWSNVLEWYELSRFKKGKGCDLNNRFFSFICLLITIITNLMQIFLLFILLAEI